MVFNPAIAYPSVAVVLNVLALLLAIWVVARAPSEATASDRLRRANLAWLGIMAFDIALIFVSQRLTTASADELSRSEWSGVLRFDMALGFSGLASMLLLLVAAAILQRRATRLRLADARGVGGARASASMHDDTERAALVLPTLPAVYVTPRHETLLPGLVVVAIFTAFYFGQRARMAHAWLWLLPAVLTIVTMLVSLVKGPARLTLRHDGFATEGPFRKRTIAFDAVSEFSLRRQDGGSHVVWNYNSPSARAGLLRWMNRQSLGKDDSLFANFGEKPETLCRIMNRLRELNEQGAGRGRAR